jgi:hypothetical protein
MTPRATSALERVEEMLAGVIALTAKVVTRKQFWQATPDDIRFLSAVAALTGEPYPGTRVQAVLTFLMTAKFRLEATASAIRDS